ncbi:MAG: HPr family phosphocarrier protein [Candidatus Saccharibacteria bacterium]|nr:HPr family phosphocarrier protein [Moraxellaceae bacterium]
MTTPALETIAIDTTLDVVNKLGLHARACGKLIEVTSRHRCDIKIGRGDSLVDAKNIMALLMLGAGKGTTLRLVIHGSDQDRAHTAIRDLFVARFHEAE